MSGELFSERFNRLNRETEEILKHRDEGLILGAIKLAQRYLDGHLTLHLHLRWRSSDPSVSRSNFPRELDADSRKLRNRIDAKLPRVNREYEFPVFVGSVYVMNEP